MSELETVPENITQEAPERSDDIGRISSLLGGDTPKPADIPVKPAEAAAPDLPEEQETAPPEPEPDPADDGEPVAIDYDQVVPMPDGAESVTIGQLKDHYQGKAEHDRERAAWDDTRMVADNQLIAAKQELYELADTVGEVNPAVLEHMQRIRGQEKARNVELLGQAFPQWENADVKKADITMMVDMLKGYGYSAAHLLNTPDYRHIKIAYDFARLLKRDAKGKAAAQKLATLPAGQSNPGRKPSKKSARTARHERAKNATSGGKLAHIAGLIEGK